MENLQRQYKPERLYAVGDTSELEKIRAFVSEKASAMGFDEQDIMKITLAVDEACSNLIRHSYHHDASKEFCVEVSVSGDHFAIEILDSGAAFNPTTVPLPNLRQYAEQHRRGGFGVQIIRMTMDSVEYFPADTTHPMNRLRLVKKIVSKLA
jgi:serine/threonine-protein kinase RsbW